MIAPEAHWVTEARAGDRAAFAELYARYERRIYSFVYRMMGNPEDAAELTQETFLKAYRALGRTNLELNVNAWLHRIAANACTDLLRRRGRVRWLPWQPLQHDGPCGWPEADPEGLLVGDETRRAVRRALGAMSPRNRQALVLREYQGLSCAELGSAMGLSPAGAKSLLFRAREEFRRLYRAPGAVGDAGER